MEWHDHRVYFTYLKNNSIENTVSLSTEKGIWIPILTMELIVPGTEHLIVKALIVRREREPIMTYDNDVLRSAEKYHGKYNPFILNQRIQAKFVCDFDRMKDYPFGIQKCFMIIGIKGVGKLVNFRMNRKNLSLKKGFNKEIEQYTIINWSVEKSINESHIVLHMKRNIQSIVMVTYLPTILMNIINQAVVYIQLENKYELIITVNITCMMVLSSVYLSVSSSLPSTPSIKPIEWWLLFNLVYPFLVIISNVVCQVPLKSQYYKALLV